MAILGNVDNSTYPLFESESFSDGTKDVCCNGCNCKVSSDHDTDTK
jgi:hypothetical protein